MDNIDYEKLREDLDKYLKPNIEYDFPLYMKYLELKSASNEKLIMFARRYQFDLKNYEKGFSRKL